MAVSRICTKNEKTILTCKCTQKRSSAKTELRFDYYFWLLLMAIAYTFAAHTRCPHYAKKCF